MLTRSRGFTLIEVAATLGALAAVGAAGAIATSQPREDARKIRDSQQVRGIHQAMVIWAQNNQDVYPLPSAVDKANDTVKDSGRAKDTTANIYSLLLYIGSLSTELLVSPVENNPSIEVDEDYGFEEPKTAVKPKMALWDPSFAADFTGGKKGNVSYAHLQPAGGRMDRWSNTFSATEPIVGTRGPEIKSVSKNGGGTVTPKLANPASATLRFYGGGAAWSGWTAHNDNSVHFSDRTIEDGKPIKPRLHYTYKDAAGKEWPDLWCYDESDDAASGNTYLGIFTKAGEKPKDYGAIWD
jgi:hypothetical protein